MDAAPAIEVRATPEHRLGMPVDAFLNTYWQKHPLLIRQAFPGFVAPLEPDDLGGLACEESALSRLIEFDRANDRWTVHTGPLDESLFARLPDRDWTVLVQDVDKWDADVARLLEHFRFLPSWRIDDVMVSYAEDGGGVGAHVDQYDVFLLQGWGKRHWSIDARPNPPTAFRDDVELKLLRRFSPSHTWTLEPGDMLYLPLGVPHDGVAEGACMTFSVGMRAPSHAELLLDFAEHLAAGMDDSDRYADPDIAATVDNTRIDEAALDRVAATLGPMTKLTDREALADWFGCFITRYRCAQFAAPPAHAMTAKRLAAALQATATVQRHPWTRMVWWKHDSGPDAILYVAGEKTPCPHDLAQRLCTNMAVSFAEPPPAPELDVLLWLVNQGYLVVTRL